MKYDISLSASRINLLPECKRCFYDANTQTKGKKVERPRGIFPSLPSGIDRVMKEWIDQYRPGGLPPHLAEYGCKGTLYGTVEEINKLRNWRSGLEAYIQIGGVVVRVLAALDDLIAEPEHTFSPYDTKTKGDEPKDDGRQYYQTQMDIYSLVLHASNMPPSGKAYIDYRYPSSTETKDAIQFHSKLYTFETSYERALQTITDAVRLLQGGQPDPSPTCDFCKFAQVRIEAAVSVLCQPRNPNRTPE